MVRERERWRERNGERWRKSRGKDRDREMER